MPRSIFFTFLFVSACLTASSQLHAQEVYVKDSLRVGVRAEPGNSGVPISVVTTGMKLEILEREGNFVKIKMASGVEGWIKATYVSDAPPAVIKLEELQVKHKELEAQVGKQSQQLQATKLNNKNLNAEIEQLKQENAELRVQLENEQQSSVITGFSYIWKVLLFVAAVIAGFALGVGWYRKQTMKRLGGLRY